MELSTGCHTMVLVCSTLPSYSWWYSVARWASTASTPKWSFCRERHCVL